MAENTRIAWTWATFNPWWGCDKVSPGCDNCYAERDAKRFHPGQVLWGADSERRTFPEKHWDQPRRWNETAIKQGRRLRVFCASMADVFDNHETAERERPKLWALIRSTPNLDWQILTKRIGNAKRMLPENWGDGYPNVWLGISCVSEFEIARDICKLFAIPATVRFMSLEPLLEHVRIFPAYRGADSAFYTSDFLHWVIIGGESGPRARPFNVQWARDLIGQCQGGKVAVFMKQLGGRPVTLARNEMTRIVTADRAGADPSEWPEDLRVQQFPVSSRSVRLHWP